MAWTVCVLSAMVGCHSTPQGADQDSVSEHLTQRIGQSVKGATGMTDIVLPPGASLEDGLTEDEAVSIALWNNAAFQELLADLGIARADLIQAGLLPNPEFVYYFGVTDKPFKYLFDFPIEALWLRPIKVKAAERETERVSQKLTQAGLDLMRDVRQAYADVALAREKVRIAGEAVKLRGRIAELAQKRLKAGDISPQEAATARIDSLQAEQDATRIGYDVPIMEEKLRNLMGIGSDRRPLQLDTIPPPPCQNIDADALTHEAMMCRPDALAAAEAVAAAQARLKFANLGWVRLLGIADATSGANGHEFGPALRFTVPLFNRNQGGIARVEMELERALRNQKTVAFQIILDVQRAHLQYRQACAELETLRTKVRPEVLAAIQRSEAAYQEGNVTIFIVLETVRQRLDNSLREAVLIGDLRRYWAELERSVGRRLTPQATTSSSPVPEGQLRNPSEPTKSSSSNSVPPLPPLPPDPAATKQAVPLTVPLKVPSPDGRTSQ
ncbi:MAG: TolC family protein [Gemmataceae bacterium]